MPRRRKRSAAPLTMLFIALCALIVLAAALFRAPLASVLWRVLGPVASWRQSLSAGEVAQLKAELASTTAALADRDALATENAALRAQLGRPNGSHSILAAVLLEPPATPYDTLVVDAGAAQGVQLGADVRAGALVIGTVDAVYANSSRATLYSAPGQSYQATLVTAGGAVPLTVEGQGAGSMQARVPAATSVAVGDRVELPGLYGGIAGSVAGIAGADTDTFKTVYLRLPVNIFELRYVYIRK